MSLSIVLFRAENIGDAFQFYGMLFSPGQWTVDSQLARLGVAVLGLATILHLTTFDFRQQIEKAFVNLPSPLQGAILVLALALVKTLLTVQRPFVYFQF